MGLIIALTFPNIAGAVSIGEAVLLSKLGEPLFAQVDLTVENYENVTDACLSLIPPDAGEDDISSYLTKASLTLKTIGIDNT
ncbi:MAG: hypothetical protein WDM70_11605 [Nitrosomonadales bacterium]